jgi:RNA polymerase sigma-70 factor (ECF subfamily)
MSDTSDRPEQPTRPEQGTSLTLLERSRANEPGAWDRLVSLYAPLVRSWCVGAGVQDADADDVVQEVCAAALNSLAGFRRDRPGDTFRGWLRGITRHLLVQHFRRSRRQLRGSGGSEALDMIHEVADPRVELAEEDSPAQMQGLYSRALEQVRGEFEERTWRMFWLTTVEERTPGAVAELMGVSAAAVRKAKSRVLHRLREELGDVIEE